MRALGILMLVTLPLLAACAASPKTVSVGDGETWEVESHISDFNRQITVLLDGEAAVSHHFVPMPPGGSSGRASFRGHDLHINCRNNPIVYGVNCVLRADGRVVAHLQHMF